jgi:hypothetical protein
MYWYELMICTRISEGRSVRFIGMVVGVAMAMLLGERQLY